MASKRGIQNDFISLPSKHQKMDERVVLGDIGNLNQASTSQRIRSNPPKDGEAVIPIIDRAPFLYRNHSGYKILSAGGDIDAVKHAVSLEHQRLKTSSKKFSKKKSSNIKRVPSLTPLEDAVVRMKKEILFGLYTNRYQPLAGDLIVFEFFNIVNNVIALKGADINVYVCGVRSFDSVEIFKDKILSYYAQSNKSVNFNPVVEWIPPKPIDGVNELYLYVEATLYDTIGEEMKIKRNGNKCQDEASSTSSSSDSLSIGSLRISTKLTSENHKRTPWATNFKHRGIPLIKAENGKTRFENLVTLAQKCQTSERSGTTSLAFEISNEHEYGYFDDESMSYGSCSSKAKIKKVNGFKNGIKKFSNGTTTIKDNDITYDCRSLSSVDISIIKLNGSKTYLSGNLKSQLAHRSGSRIFKCIFCSKTFSYLEALKLHLNLSYPSFKFVFNKSTISVIFDKESYATESLKTSKIKSRETHGLCKIELNPKIHQEVTSAAPPGFPHKVNTKYSLISVPVEGLYGHEIPHSFIKQAMKKQINEFDDLEDHEKAFYYLWNTFNSQRSNRAFGMLSLYDRLVNFIENKYSILEKYNLISVWLIFLTHTKMTGVITERQFLQLSFYGTKLENCVIGLENPIM